MEFSSSLFNNVNVYKGIAIGIGTIGLLLGIKSSQNEKIIGLTGIFLSLILIVLTFVPILNLFLANSALNINIK